MDRLQKINKYIRGWLPEPGLPQLNRAILTASETRKRRSLKYSVDKELIPAYLIYASIGIVSVVVSLIVTGVQYAQIVWIILGIAIGLAFGTLITLKQLEFLAQKGEKKILSQTITLTVFLVVLLLLVIIPDDIIPVNIRTGEYFLLWSIISSLLISRSLLLYTWERRNRVRIYQNQWSSYFYVVDNS